MRRYRCWHRCKRRRSGCRRRLPRRICYCRRNTPSSTAVSTKAISRRIFAAAPPANEHAAQFGLRLRILRPYILRLRCLRAYIWQRSGWRKYRLRRSGCRRGLLLYSTDLRRIRGGRRNANLSPAVPTESISRRVFAAAPPASECAPQLRAAVAAEPCARMRAAPAYGTSYWACCH